MKKSLYTLLLGASFALLQPVAANAQTKKPAKQPAQKQKTATTKPAAKPAPGTLLDSVGLAATRLYTNLDEAKLTPAKVVRLRLNMEGQFPQGLGKFTNLQSLEVIGRPGAGQGIEMIPAEVFNLTNLQILRLPDVGMRMLSPEIGKLTNLRLLDLTGNPINAIGNEIGDLQKLEELRIAGAGARELPQSLIRLPKLRRLETSAHQLSPMPSLRELVYVAEMPMIPEAVSRLDNLNTLIIRTKGRLEIGQLHMVLGSMRQLRRLELPGQVSLMELQTLGSLPIEELSLESLQPGMAGPAQTGNGPAMFPSLRSLSIKKVNCGGPDECKQAYASLSGLPGQEELTMPYNAAAMELYRKYKRVNLIFGSEPTGGEAEGLEGLGDARNVNRIILGQFAREIPASLGAIPAVRELDISQAMAVPPQQLDPALKQLKSLEKIFLNAEQARNFAPTMKLDKVKELHIVKAFGPDGNPLPSRDLSATEIASLKKSNPALKVVVRS